MTVEVESWFRESGWRARKDDVGDLVCTIDLGGDELEVIPNLVRDGDAYILRGTPSLASKGFTHVANLIFGRPKRYPAYRPSKHAPIIVGDWLEVSTGSASLDGVRILSRKARDWARQQSTTAAIERFSESAGQTGQRQLWHLTALSLMGRPDQLRSYRVGEDRVLDTFLPMIDRRVLERAIEIAELAAGLA